MARVKAKKKAKTKKATRRSPRKASLPTGYFLELTVQNVRCFGDQPQTLRLCDDVGRPARWTILLGNNGTGKSTLLQALAALAPARDPPRIGADGKPLSPSAFPALFHFARWSLRGKWRPLRSKEGSATLRVRCCDDWRFASTRTPTKIGRAKAEIRIGSMNATSVALPEIDCFGYGPARRLSPSTVTESESDDPCASLFSEDADLRNAEEWLLRLDYSASKSSKIQAKQRTRLGRVKGLLCDLLPDVSDIRITQPKEKSPTPTAQFRTPYGWVPLRDLGQGYQTLIAWVVDFAARMLDRCPKSTNPLAEPAVVLIDEIDLHLHPSWQRSVMQYLSEKFPNTQFIATAHSPLIVQAAHDANVVLLRQEGDHVVIENDVKSIRGWRIDQILTSDLFGLATARPPELETKLKRRKALLTKSRLTKEDKRELAKLEEEIGHLPIGETAAEAEELKELVDKTWALLEKYQD